jgi:hypothetical protein
MSNAVAERQEEYGDAVYWYCRACKIQKILATAVTRYRCPRCRAHMKWQREPIQGFGIVDDNGKVVES